jgi:hypothetical protein
MHKSSCLATLPQLFIHDRQPLGLVMSGLVATIGGTAPQIRDRVLKLLLIGITLLIGCKYPSKVSVFSFAANTCLHPPAFKHKNYVTPLEIEEKLWLYWPHRVSNELRCAEKPSALRYCSAPRCRDEIRNRGGFL